MRERSKGSLESLLSYPMVTQITQHEAFLVCDAARTHAEAASGYLSLAKLLHQSTDLDCSLEW